MKDLPEHVRVYRRTPDFDETSIPAGLRKDHRTAAGVWGIIRVSAGSLLYRISETGEETVLTPDTPGIVEPEVLHSVTPLGPVSFHVAFCR